MSSIVSLLQMFMGNLDDFHALLTNAPVFGPILFFTYMIVITLILINLFIGIICDTFAAVDEVLPLVSDLGITSNLAKKYLIILMFPYW